MTCLRLLFVRLGKLLRALIKPSGLSHLRKANLLLICADADRTFCFENQSYSPLIDSIGSFAVEDAIDVITVAEPGSKLVGKKSSGNPISLDGGFFRAKAMDVVLHGLGTNLEIRFWLKVLKAVGPKCVIGIQPRASFCFAAKLAGVPIYDLQHGLIEPGYYYNERTDCALGSKGLPTAVLCWDESSQEALKDAAPHLQSYVLGNPWIERLAFPTENDRLATFALEQSRHLPKYANDAFLLTLHWSSSEKNKLQIPQQIIDAISELISEGCACFLRFHPSQKQFLGKDQLHLLWKDATNLSIDETLIVDVSDLALPLVLLNVKAHLSAFSASAIEASHFGLQTLLWHDTELTRSWFKYFCSDGDVQFAADQNKSIFAWVKQTIEENKKNRQVRKIMSFDRVALRSLVVYED